MFTEGTLELWNAVSKNRGDELASTETGPIVFRLVSGVLDVVRNAFVSPTSCFEADLMEP